MYRKCITSYLLMFSLFLVVNFFATQLSIQPSTKDKICYSLFNKLPEEGFCAGTLVKIPSGYESIENLVVGDTVVDADGNQTEILAITRHYVDEYIKFYLKGAVVCMGCDQRFSLFLDAPWTVVRDLFFDNEHIMHPIILYALTTQSHTLRVTLHDVFVHNSAAIFAGASSVCIGYVAVINPVVATIGVTVALSLVAHKAYQVYTQECTENDETIALPIDVLLAERFYYIQRAAALETIKQELFCIKNGLKNIKVFCCPDSVSFTYQFLKQTNTQNIYHQNQLLKISAEYEMQLSDKQKENLRVLREIELESLEQEVVALQCVLALHVDELIKQIDSAGDEYKETQEQTSRTVTLWNNNCSNMTYTIALQSYKAILLQEDLLNSFDQKLSELKIVAQYYTNCANTICVEQSTNIIELLEKLGPVIIEYDQWVATEKSRIAKNINVVEEHFIGRGITAPNLKNGIKNELAKGRKNINGQVVAEAKNKLVSIAVSSGPNKPPKKDDDSDDDDDEQPFGKYEDAPYHHKNSTGTKSISPDNGQDALNHSIASPNQNSKRRYGVSQSGQYVVFDETSPRLYHGHVVEWGELSKVKGLQKELIMQGMASKFGKAIYKIAKKIIKR